MESIPTTQWAQVFQKTGGPVEYKQIPVQKPGHGEVLVNVKFSGVCHTDLHALQGDWPLETKLPLVGGHEGAGIVVALGEMVDDIQIGDKVGIKWLGGSCLSCEFCQVGDEPLCPHALLSGYTVDGTFQQYAIAKAAHVARIHKDIELSSVAPILCAGITVYKALKESGVRPGQTVAIVGAGGGLGSIALQYAKAMGVRTIAIDGGEDKRVHCGKLGAGTYIDFMTTKDVVKDVKAATEDGYGPHAVILLAVSEKPFQQAAAYVRPRGTVVAVGMPAGAYLRAPVFDTVVRMITIKGSYVGNRKDTQEALDFFRLGKINAPVKVMGMSELTSVYDQMKAGTILGRIVVDTSK